MPSKPIDYSKTVIYKLVCNDLTVIDIYVGHSAEFRSRKSQHKARCNNANRPHYNLKVYTIIRANGGWDNWSMIEIEKYPCNDANEATARERFWYEELNAKLNSRFPQRSDDEYRKTEEYRLKAVETSRKQREKNKTAINERNRIFMQNYTEEHREEVNKRTLENYHKRMNNMTVEDRALKNEKARAYREKNKEKMKENNRNYFERKLLKESGL